MQGFAPEDGAPPHHAKTGRVGDPGAEHHLYGLQSLPDAITFRL